MIHFDKALNMMKQDLIIQSDRINVLIAATPTGEKRNSLCDAHIHLLAALDKLKEV